MLGIVGPSYEPYQNNSFANLFTPLISDGVADIETCGSLYGGRRIWFMAKFRAEQDEIEKGDKVVRYLLGAHGHDGQFAMHFGPSVQRVVCANTLAVALGEGTQFKCLHTQNLESNLEVLRDAIVHWNEDMDMTVEKYRQLARKTVTRAELREYARILVEASEDDREWTHGQKDKIGKIVGNAVEGRGNNGRTWWSAYNGFTEHTSWQRHKTVEKRVDSMWFGESAKLNQQALELALSMSA